jgi:hypothetical protein
VLVFATNSHVKRHVTKMIAERKVSMTILAILALLLGILLVSDGAFSRGLLVSLLPDPGPAIVSVIRLAEVALGGLIFAIVGFVASTCK